MVTNLQLIFLEYLKVNVLEKKSLLIFMNKNQERHYILNTIH
ncbi:hypothetical protein XBKQ1_2110002 [Xenorhabdus bovienii str. kraussei Quebec]|uniref:Uncharacterized protein n=1 Tax=Xenorhabdus bovienii str. kraussei Quebec TaxID=1398203 RepID=A0A077PFG6_XENBV|nr:hypothetical protein XBKQ1_2110002 [Xenorhabdus bovienii str. kraussei Quebec]